MKQLFCALIAVTLAFTATAAATANESPAYSRVALYETSVKLTVRQLHRINLKSSEPQGVAQDQMTFVSSNPKVVAVEDGNAIRAIAPGRATITVRPKSGSAKATLRVRVVGFNKKLRFYDVKEDAAAAARKAPLIIDNRQEMSRQSAPGQDAALAKYGDLATAANPAAAVVENSGGELYFAALYTMLQDTQRGGGYIVLPAAFPGCSAATMAQIRTWLRESFDGIVIGMAEDFAYEAAPFTPLDLYAWGGAELSIGDVFQASETRFLVNVSIMYADQGMRGFRAMFERTPSGWLYDGYSLFWIV